MQKSFIISLIVAVLLVILVLQNSGTAELQFYFWKLEAPLMLLLFIVILLGALVSSLLSLGKVWSLKKELKNANKRIARLEAQLEVKNVQVEKKEGIQQPNPKKEDNTPGKPSE